MRSSIYRYMKALLKPFYLFVYVTRDFQRGEGFFCPFHSGGGKGLGRGGGGNDREGKGKSGGAAARGEKAGGGLGEGGDSGRWWSLTAIADKNFFPLLADKKLE